ncbi:MAG: excinuclease ABC subunit UvrC, partial [Steroidobacteraceae bacterium]
MEPEPGATAAAAAFDLQSFLQSLPGRPGVYRMLDKAGSILYVGKARNLKNRVSSYFHGRAHSAKTIAMVAQVGSVEVTVTASETEALLLEFNLIKQHKPRYNILLKDDKSFPFIHVSSHAYPRIACYRGTRNLAGRFFGPYPSTVATRETLLLLQKLFRLRPCEDTFYANRSRPCLQYQINRCTGPCVGLVTAEAYAQDVHDAIGVLDGRNAEVIEDLGRRMEEASGRLAFEQAARLRDQIQMLKQIQASQAITRIAGHDIDAVAIACEGGETCVSVVFVRGGRNLGSTNYFPRGGLGDEAEMLAAFLAQYYLAREAPPEIILALAIEGAAALEQALGDKAGHAVRVRAAVRGTRARWLDMALCNALLG